MQAYAVLLDEVERWLEIMLQALCWYAPNEQDALEVLFERLLTRPKKLSRQLRTIT
jgi:hypothetical protein